MTSTSGISNGVRLQVLPEIGARIPAVVPRIVLALVGTLLCLDRFAPGFWLVVGLVLTALAVVVPQRLSAWALMLVFGINQALRDPSLDWHFFALLAGVHLVHVLAAQVLVLPTRGWLQLAVFRRPLLRYLAIQVPAQGLAVLVLALQSAGDAAGIAPAAFAIVGAVALVALTVLLVMPLLREPAR